MARACVLVLDAVGAGDLPDAAEFGTAGSNTLQHVAEAVGGLELPTLTALGLGNILPLRGCPPRRDAPAVYGRLERAKPRHGHHHGPLGDDGDRHREALSDVSQTAFPQTSFERFCHATGRGVIGNVAASGTEIIQELGEAHQRTGDWIVYTSADSVFQIAAHEQTVPVEELYGACRIARELLVGRARRRPGDRAPVRR